MSITDNVFVNLIHQLPLSRRSTPWNKSRFRLKGEANTGISVCIGLYIVLYY